MERVEFAILGPLEARADGRELALGGKRQRAVLALLVLEANRVVSTDRLIEAVWGERAPPAAEATLQGYVSRLRKAIGADLVRTAPPGYELQVDADAIDLGRFQRLAAEAKALLGGEDGRAAELLREALALWRGPPLADLADTPFAGAEQARLEELRLAAVEDRIEAELALGLHAELVPELEVLVRAEPLRERLRAQLMLALYRSGRQAEALDAYREARLVLVDELGLDPSRSLQELETAILRQDPSLDLRGVPSTARVTALVGRDAELDELEAALDSALAGHGGVVVVTGEPGIGKSQLVEEFLARASARGCTTVVGRCWEAGGAPPYWPWNQTVRSYLAGLDPDEIRSVLGPQLEAVGASVPTLQEVLPELRSVQPQQERFRVFEDSVTFFRLFTQHHAPHVSALDDLHAADEPSLLLLRHMASRLSNVSGLVVAVWRDTGLALGPVEDHLAAVIRDAKWRIHLEGLGPDDVRELVARVTGGQPSDELIAAIHATTDGNPLFVSEIVRLLEAEGQLDDDAVARPRIPRGVREVIGSRLDRLSDRTRTLLTVASVLGPNFYVNSLERVSGLSRDELLDSLDEALAARELEEDPDAAGRLRFAHVLIRDSLYDGLTPTSRMRLHAQVGQALEEIYGSASDGRLAELAHHFVEAGPAGDVQKAADYAERAAGRALEQLAFEEAERLFRVALQARELAGADPRRTAEILLGLGEARARAGHVSAAREAFLGAAEIARQDGLAEHLGRAALGVGGRFVWGRGSEDPELIPLLDEALAELGEQDTALRARLLARLAGAHRDDREREPRDSLSAEAVEVARRVGDPATLAYALEGRWDAAWWPENPAERLAIATELVELSQHSRDLERAFEAHHHRCAALIELGRPVEADAELELARRVADELHQPAQQWPVASIRALRALAEGRFEEAEAFATEALRVGGDTLADARIAYRVQLFLLRREQGRLAEVERELAASLVEYPTRPVASCLLVHLHAVLGREREAHRMLDELAAGGFAAIPQDQELLFSLSFLPRACAVLGDRERAATLYELLLPHEGRIACDVSDGDAGPVERLLGHLAAQLGRRADAARWYEAAVERCDELGYRPWAAHARHAYARLLVDSGDESRSRELAGAALDAARELGMVELERAASPLL